jgi:phosphoribosylformylglycinamidine synthase PurS subunit
VTVDIQYAVNVRPKDGILDPQGRAVEGSLDHLGIAGVSAVRVGRRIDLTVAAADDAAARAVVEKLASELLSNPLIESFDIEVLGAASSIDSETASGTASGASEPAASPPAASPLATPEGAST